MHFVTKRRLTYRRKLAPYSRLNNVTMEVFQRNVDDSDKSLSLLNTSCTTSLAASADEEEEIVFEQKEKLPNVSRFHCYNFLETPRERPLLRKSKLLGSTRKIFRSKENDSNAKAKKERKQKFYQSFEDAVVDHSIDKKHFDYVSVNKEACSSMKNKSVKIGDVEEAANVHNSKRQKAHKNKIITVEIGPGPLGLMLKNNSSKQAVIGKVKDNSPLIGKIENGDRITKLNGEDVSDMDARDLAKRLTRTRMTLVFQSSPEKQYIVGPGLPPIAESTMSNAETAFLPKNCSNEMCKAVKEDLLQVSAPQKMCKFVKEDLHVSAPQKICKVVQEDLLHVSAPQKICKVVQEDLLHVSAPQSNQVCTFVEGIFAKNENDILSLEKYLFKVIEVAKNHGHAIFNNIGNFHYRKGQFNLATKFYKKSLKYVSNCERVCPMEDSGLIFNLGRAFLKRDETSKALTCFELSLKGTAPLKDDYATITYANLQTKIAEVHFREKSYQLSLKHYLSAFRTKKQIFQSDYHPECSVIRHSIGLVLSKLGRLSEALFIFRDILIHKSDIGINDAHLAKLLLDISEIYVRKGSEDSLKEARTNCRFAGEILERMNLGREHSYLRQMQRLSSRIP